MTLAFNSSSTAASGGNTEDLARTPASELLAALVAAGTTPAPHLSHGELVAAVIAHRLQQGERVVGAGVLEVLPEGFGFLRSLPFVGEASPHDPFVTPSQIRSLNLKSGHRLHGPLRAPKGNERYFSLAHVDAVNGAPPGELTTRIAFSARTPTTATRPLALAATTPALRALAEFAPWCRGQRALFVVPAAFPQRAMLGSVALALHAADPSLRILVGAIDQRPEALAALRAQAPTTPGFDVCGSTFDQPPKHHLAVAETLLALAMREVEAGHDVVLVFDSLTALARAAQREQSASGRWLCPGLDAQAVLPGKRLFAAARACAEGGSLTVLALANAATAGPDFAVLHELQLGSNSDVVVAAGEATAESAGEWDAALPFDLRLTHTRSEDDARPVAVRQAAERRRASLLALPATARAAAWCRNGD